MQGARVDAVRRFRIGRGRHAQLPRVLPEALVKDRRPELWTQLDSYLSLAE